MILKSCNKLSVDVAAQGWKCKAWLNIFYCCPDQTIHVETRLKYCSSFAWIKSYYKMFYKFRNKYHFCALLLSSISLFLGTIKILSQLLWRLKALKFVLAKLFYKLVLVTQCSHFWQKHIQNPVKHLDTWPGSEYPAVWMANNCQHSKLN